MAEPVMEEQRTGTSRTSWHHWGSLHIWRIRAEDDKITKYRRILKYLVLTTMVSALFVSSILVNLQRNQDEEHGEERNNETKKTPRIKIGNKNTPCITYDDISILCADFIEELHRDQLLELLQTFANKNKDEALITFRNATFKDNKLQSGWLPLQEGFPKITSLTLNSPKLIEIEDYGLSDLKDLKKLTIATTSIAHFSKNSVRGLRIVDELSITDNAYLDTIEDGFLQEFSLASLQIHGLQYDKMDGPKFFKNLTGGVILPKLNILDLAFNSISTFPAEILPGFSGVISLYIQQNGLKDFDPAAFQTANTLRQIHLETNVIETLPEAIFGPIVRRGVVLSAKQNLFRCDCHMLWLQEFVKNATSSGADYGDFNEIICKNPADLANELFLNVTIEPCDDAETTTDPSLSTTTTTTKTTIPDGTTSTPSTTTPRTPGQTYCNAVENNIPITITLDPGSAPFKIIDDESDGRNVDIEIDEFVPIESELLIYRNGYNMTCHSISNKSVRIGDLTPDTIYFICLFSDDKLDSGNLGNCILHKTMLLPEFRSWITVEDRPWTLAYIAIGVASAALLGGFLAYGTVRMYPTLLRGSDRIEVVKSRVGEKVLVMPGKQAKSTSADYDTISGYISVLPNDGVSGGKRTPPPPLPPYPPNWVPRKRRKEHDYLEPGRVGGRLPRNMDLLLEYEWYTSQQSCSTSDCGYRGERA